MLRSYNKFLSLLFVLSISVSVNAGPTGTWGSSTTHQFFPTVIQALLGNGWSLVPSQVYFGDCSDGNVTISSGTTTLVRDMFYNNLTITGTGFLSFQNQRVFVCGILNLSGAQAFAMNANGNTASSGTAGGNAGGGGATVAVGTNLTGHAGVVGGTGTTAVGTQAGVASGGNTVANSSGGAGGAGGAGSGFAGGASRAAIAVTNFPMRDIVASWFLPVTGSGAQVFVAGGAPGGSGGGGDGAASGGGGGGGGGSGQSIYLAANIIQTDNTTAGAVIAAWGGGGGQGGTPTSGNTGGGGGGGGGSGGWAVVKYNTRIGPTVTSGISTLGGNSFGTTGLHGNGHGTGSAGSNGAIGGNGLIQILNIPSGQSITSVTGSADL